ncbi:MAG: hypothetical protein RH948_15115, partial [Cyclobacteriaceae bacterium]
GCGACAKLKVKEPLASTSTLSKKGKHKKPAVRRTHFQIRSEAHGAYTMLAAVGQELFEFSFRFFSHFIIASLNTITEPIIGAIKTSTILKTVPEIDISLLRTITTMAMSTNSR